MAISKSSSFFLALLVLLSLLAFPSAASQLNLYKGQGCTGFFTVCWDRQCCAIPSDVVSYKFYYNPDWKAYFFGGADCTGAPSNVLQIGVSCSNAVTFKSALLTDKSDLKMVTEEV